MFGEYLKLLRKRSGIPSKKLANMVNKSAAYVSQIENGRNKRPEFDVAFELLKIVGVDEEKIESILEYYNIVSPLKEQENHEALVQKFEKKFLSSDTERLRIDLKNRNDKLYTLINEMIENDITTATSILRIVSSKIEEAIV